MIDISSLAYFVISIALLLLSYIFKNKDKIEATLMTKVDQRKQIKRG